VDQEARDNGYALQVDGWVVDDALPVDVADGEHVLIVDPAGRTEPLDLMPGEAWEITGPMGEAWMSLLNEEIRTDLIAVRGSPSSIEALAMSLDAQVLIEGDLTYLSAEDILYDAPWVEDADALAVDDVALVRVEAEAAQEAVVTQTEPAQVGPVGRVPAVPSLRAIPPATGPAVSTSASPHADPSSGIGAVEETADPAIALDEPRSTDPRVGDDARPRYAGMFLCRDDVLWLDASGVYAFRGINGVWTVTTPGVVRLNTPTGEVLFRAAISPDRNFCRDVWSPEETGDPMPEGYGRFSLKKRGPNR